MRSLAGWGYLMYGSIIAILISWIICCGAPMPSYRTLLGAVLFFVLWYETLEITRETRLHQIPYPTFLKMTRQA